MGANVGTTVTAWLLSLGGIQSDAVWVQLLKPSSFTPVLALIGIVIAFAHFQNSYKLAQSRSASAIGTQTQEGDDFYE